MPTHLTLRQHLTGLHEAMLAFARYADRAGLDSEVPTCPDWTVRRLIGHQGAIHRWARDCLRGTGRLDDDHDQVARQGRRNPDPVEWLRDGAIDLVSTLASGEDAADVPVFLPDAPPPREFWARRQCHETTLHAVDALAAFLGRLPTADETWIGPDLALDGVDELLTGFLPRRRCRLRSPEPLTVAVRATDSEHSWTVRVSEEPPVTTRHVGPVEGDRTVEGSTVQLYLALWHRSDELASSDAWPLWHDAAVR